jgi:RHS repeat-associated protein
VIRRVFMLPFSRSSRRTTRAVVVGVTSAAVVLGWAVPAVPAASAAASAPLALATGDQPMLGAGVRPNATRLSFQVGDRVTAQVDVGSGNLLVTTKEISLRNIQDGVDIGVAYNSVALGTSFAQGYPGTGWRMRVGADVKLAPNADGSVTYVGPDGLTGVFVLKTGSTTTYTAPVGFKADLVKTGTTGWTLTEHASGKKSTFTASGQLDFIDDRNGQRTDFTYTGASLTKVVSSLGTINQRTVNVTANSNGLLASLGQTGAGSTVQRHVTYGHGGTDLHDLTSILDTENRTTTFGYDAAHQLTSITNTGGAVTRFTYDSAHRVTSVKQENPAVGSPGDSITRLSYASSTQTLLAEPNTDQTQPVSAVPHTTYNLNSNGDLRVASAVDPAGNTRSATYTPFADVATFTTPAGTSTYGHSSTVNGGESLTSTQAPMGADTSAAYANTGALSKFLPSSTTSEQGNTSTYTFDGAGNQLSSSDATAAQAKVTYNADGTVATSTDPGNGTNSTTYTYNTTTHQLTGVTPPTGTTLGTRSFSYDPFGRLGSSTSGRGITTTYGYDTLDRLTSVTYSDGTPSVTYSYDAAGRLHTRVDTTGTTTWNYDPLGRLTSRTSTSGGGTLSYGYDKSSNLTSVSDAHGTTTYGYDSRNLQTSMTTGKGTVLRYAYNADGKRTDSWFATNTTNTVWAAHTHTDYDKSNRVARTWTARNSSDTTRFADLSYCRSPFTGAACPTLSAASDTGLIFWSVDNLTGARTTYTYNTADRLTGATTTGTGGKTFTYTYDARGNRLTAADGTTTQTRTYNPGNQITTTGYTHDGAGNLTTDPNAGTITYNGADQMISAASTTSPTYRYAGTTQDELVHQLAGGGTIDYVYGRTDRNGLPLIRSLTKKTVLGTLSVGTVSPAFVPTDLGTSYLDHDANGTPQVLTTAAGVENFYVFDGSIGNVLGLIDTTGTVVAAYAYDPYGNYTTTNSTGLAAADNNPYRTAGGLSDLSTGWIKYGQRWYNPTIGRFTQQDSIEHLTNPQDGNRYAYAADDPINNIDPTGSLSFGAVLSTVGGLFVGGGFVTVSVALCPLSLGIGCIAGAVAAGAVGGLLGGATGAVVGGASPEDAADDALLGGISGALTPFVPLLFG